MVLLIVILTGLTVIAIRLHQKEEATKPTLLAKHCRRCGADVETPNSICPYCGFDVYDGYNYCPECGGNTLEGQKQCTNCKASLLSPISQDDASALGLISFLIPLVGFIIYAVLSDSKPAKAKIALNGALAGLVVGGLIFLIFVLM